MRAWMPHRGLAAVAALVVASAPVFAQTPVATQPYGSTATSTHAQGHEAAPLVPQGRPALITGELTTERFRILYTEKSEGSARALAERVEATREAFRAVFGRDWPGVTEIRLANGREEMNALTLSGSRVPRWAEALAWPSHNVILVDAMSLVQPHGEITLRHELSHVALGQLSGEWPRWFQEGVAMYVSGDRFSVTQYAAMFRAVTQKRLFNFEDLAHTWPEQPSDVEIAYAQSVTFVAHLAQRYGQAQLGELVEQVQGGASFEVAFARAFLTSLSVEQDAWAKDLPSRYSWTPILTGGTVLWSAAALLLVVGWVRRRRVMAVRMAELAAEDAAEDAAHRLALAAQALPAPEGSSPPGADDGASWVQDELGGEHPDDWAADGSDDSDDDADGDEGPDGEDDDHALADADGDDDAVRGEDGRPRRLLH